jgi:alpha-beta hydrolase superfamily lysophospholipase
MKPSYPKEMRERAKQDGTHLVTVDVPGLCFQGPVTKEQVKEAVEMLTRWFEERKSPKSKRKAIA